jgi:membrane fusion protein (multidrug efflux system)
MRRRQHLLGAILAGAWLAAGAPWLACRLAFAQAAAPPPQPVGTVTAAMQPTTPGADFVGRVEAIDRVEVRARVTGFLLETFFKEGDTVQEGAKLFQIDPAPFQAALQQAQGALQQAQGTLDNATTQRRRAEELLKTSATSVATRDDRLAAERNAQGALTMAEANVKSAQINLDYATIVAPIAGRIGRAKVTRGNVVSPETGPLTLIVSQDPMYVAFPVSQREFLRVRQEGREEKRENLIVKLRFADGSYYDQNGVIDFVDVTVNKDTDTIMVRARVPNPAGALTDGQYVRVVVQRDKPVEKIVIPQSALLANQSGLYVFVVEDGKAAPKQVKTGGEVGTGVAIEQGLNVGDLVVVSGLQSLRPGAPVVATPASSPGNLPALPAAAPANGG